MRELADQHGLLLIFDEVQSGVGRTGHLFAHEHYGITPDIMSLAKGIGGGFPVGACLATEHAASGMVVGTHGSTYGGNPLAMAAVNASLDVIDTPEFLAHVTEMGARLRSGLEQMIPNHDHLFDHVRGVGLMLGLRMKSDSRAFVGHARSHGILTVSAGDNVVRLLPPLIIEERHIREAIDKLSDAARAYVPGPSRVRHFLDLATPGRAGAARDPRRGTPAQGGAGRVHPRASPTPTRRWPGTIWR